MNSNQPGTNADIRTTKIIHLAILAGQVIFGALVFYLIHSGLVKGQDAGQSRIFLFLVPIMAIGLWIMDHLLYGKLILAARAGSNLKEKLAGYRTALITRYGMFEGVTLFAIVACLLTGKLLFLIIAGALILVFVAIRPVPERIIKDLDLSPSEEMKMLKGE